jgi:hypothetical protein
MAKLIKKTDASKVLTNPVKYCEEMYPETMKTFRKLQEDDYKIFCKKQMDYGPGNIAMGTTLQTDDERLLSTTATIVRMNDKVQRLLNLVVKNRRSPQNESVDDAFMDLSVYGVIARIVTSDKWAK